MTHNYKTITNKINSYVLFTVVLKFLCFVLYAYSLLCFIFWLLNCFEVDWLYLFNWLFIVPYKLVSLVYKPQGLSADLTLAIIGIVSFIAGLISQHLVIVLEEQIIELDDERIRIKTQEREQRKIRQAQKNQQENDTSTRLAKKVISNARLVLIISPLIKKIKKQKNDRELTFQELESWKQLVNKELIKNLNYSKPIQKGYYRKNLFIVYRDFNLVDKLIYYTKPTLASIKEEFKKEDIRVSFLFVVSAIPEGNNIENELDCMDTIISLNFTQDIIVTNRFKINYDNKETKRYNLVLKGEYNLSKNLSVSNNQPIYSLMPKKVKKPQPKEKGET